MGSTTVKETRDEKQTLDPATEARLQENYDHSRAVTDIPYKPFTGQRVASFDPSSTAAQNRLLDVSYNDPGAEAFGKAKGIFSQLGDYTPQQIKAPFQIQPRTLTSGTPITAERANAISVDPTLLKDVDLSPYLNPYDDQVVDRFLADNERSRQIQSVNDAQQATAARSFGGSRHGVKDSLTNEAFGRTAATTLAGLRQGGYDRAIAGATGDVDRTNSARVLNANNIMDTERFNIGNKMGLDQFNTNARMTADRYNADAGMAADQFNIGTSMDAQSRNVANDMASAEFRANMANMIKGMSDADLARQLQLIGLEDTVGMSRQAMEQAFNDAAFEAYQMEYQDVYNRLNARNTALGMFPALVNTNSTSTRTENKGPMGIISPLLGAAGMALGGPLGGMLGGSLFGTAAAGAGGAIGSGISSAARYVR